MTGNMRIPASIIPTPKQKSLCPSGSVDSLSGKCVYFQGQVTGKQGKGTHNLQNHSVPQLRNWVVSCLLGYFPNPWNAEKLSAATRFFGIAETIEQLMAHFYTWPAPMYPVLVLLPAFDAGSFYVIAFPDKDHPCAAWQLSCIFWGSVLPSCNAFNSPILKGGVYLYSGYSFSKIRPCATTLFCSKRVTCRQLNPCF